MTVKTCFSCWLMAVSKSKVSNASPFLHLVRMLKFKSICLKFSMSLNLECFPVIPSLVSSYIFSSDDAVKFDDFKTSPSKISNAFAPHTSAGGKLQVEKERSSTWKANMKIKFFFQELNAACSPFPFLIKGQWEVVVERTSSQLERKKQSLWWSLFNWILFIVILFMWKAEPSFLASYLPLDSILVLYCTREFDK